MANLYEVTAHSVTVPTRGFDHNGNEASGRHWYKGALIELEDSEAKSLLAAKAVAQSAKPAPVSTEADKSKDAKKDGK